MKVRLNKFGCTNGDCIFKTKLKSATHYGGQHTNSSCKCVPAYKMHPDERIALKKEIKRLVKERDVLAESLIYMIIAHEDCGCETCISENAEWITYE